MPDPVAVWWSLFSGVALLGVKECTLIAELSASDRCWGPMASLWPSGSCSGSPVAVRESFLSFLCYFNLRLPLLLRTCIFQNLFFFFVLCSFIHITFSHDCPSPHPIEFKAIWPYMAPPHPPHQRTLSPCPFLFPVGQLPYFLFLRHQNGRLPLLFVTWLSSKLPQSLYSWQFWFISQFQMIDFCHLD